MGTSAIIGSPKRPWTGCVAAISGALLSAFAAAGPAQSGDLYNPYEYSSYRYGPEAYRGYSRNCYSCGCYQCGCCATTHRRSRVIERHWVEREYYERRLAVGGYPYRSYGYGDGRSYGYGDGRSYGYRDGRSYGYGDSSPPWGAPRPHLGYGGIQYQPSPILYEDEAPPRSPYDYEGPPRPPIGIPSAYYNDGYVE